MQTRSANGKAEYRAVEVDNPYHSKDHPEDATNPKRIAVTINLKESAVVSLAVRGRLEPHQIAAAECFRRSFEVACGLRQGPSLAERVSHANGPRAYAATLAQANQDMTRSRLLLGQRSHGLVVAVCGQGMALPDLFEVKRDRLTAADNLRHSLDDLAQMWGLAQPMPATP